MLTGKANPYVRIGIINAASQEEEIVKKRNLLQWLEEDKVMPTGEVVETKLCRDTLQPQWDETLELWVCVCECAYMECM